MPAALSLSTRAFRIPGPHHWDEDEAPTATGFARNSMVVSPGSIRAYDASPKRRGRSAEFPPECQGEAKALRDVVPDGRIVKGRFSDLITCGATTTPRFI